MADCPRRLHYNVLSYIKYNKGKYAYTVDSTKNIICTSDNVNICPSQVFYLS